MSGTTVAPLTDDEMVDVRRYCGFPAYGLGPTLDPFNRTFAGFPAFEFRVRNLQPREITVVRARVAALANAETELEAASDNLDTASAAVYTHNANEVADRISHFDMLRRRLCQFLGVGTGPELSQSSRSISLIV